MTTGHKQLAEMRQYIEDLGVGLTERPLARIDVSLTGEASGAAPNAAPFEDGLVTT